MPGFGARIWPKAALALGVIVGAAAGAVPGCGGDDPSAQVEAAAGLECQADDQAFVRRALLALNGRRPLGQAEVRLYEDIIQGIRASEWGEAASDPSGDALMLPRRTAARAMMNEPSFRLRWAEFFMDALRVGRDAQEKASPYDAVQLRSCYGPALAEPADNGTLAAWVRDHHPSETNPPVFEFRMGQLLSSTIELDDLRPLYLAHLFAMISFPLPGANVAPLELERNRRLDFGRTFSAAYLHRDRSCLPCHNSEFSVTQSADPATSRAWPVVGAFERALYGSPEGTFPSEEETTKGSGELRAISMLRFVDVAAPIDELEDVTNPPGVAPYGWDGLRCGRFEIPQSADPLGVDTYFGSIQSTPQDPQRGRRASVWQLEPALRRGFALLAEHGLQLNDRGEVEDPDVAFAYLVAQNVVEHVWTDVVGSGLTIANYFPRSQVQRDILASLTERFVASRYSLKELLLDIVTHPAFNLKAPSDNCGESYDLPTIFDPWTVGEKDPGRRGNSPADAVHPLRARLLRRALHSALEWPAAPDFPEGEELSTQATLGYFISNSEPGFRGFDFQARLVWESLYGRCRSPGPEDFISKLVDRASASAGSTVADAVIVLKDRLIGEPWIDPAEAPLLEDLLGAPLASTEVAGLEDRIRLVCGAYAASPQFTLDGVAPPSTQDEPALTPPEASYLALCEEARQRFDVAGLAYSLECGASAVPRPR